VWWIRKIIQATTSFFSSTLRPGSKLGYILLILFWKGLVFRFSGMTCCMILAFRSSYVQSLYSLNRWLKYDLSFGIQSIPKLIILGVGLSSYINGFIFYSITISHSTYHLLKFIKKFIKNSHNKFKVRIYQIECFFSRTLFIFIESKLINHHILEVVLCVEEVNNMLLIMKYTPSSNVTRNWWFINHLNRNYLVLKPSTWI